MDLQSRIKSVVDSLARILEGGLSYSMVLLLERESDGVSDVGVDVRRGVKDLSRSTDDNVMGLMLSFPVVAGKGEGKRRKDWEEDSGKSDEVDHCE